MPHDALIACPDCGCHVPPRTCSCPECGTKVATCNQARLTLAAVLMGLAGCMTFAPEPAYGISILPTGDTATQPVDTSDTGVE